MIYKKFIILSFAIIFIAGCGAQISNEPVLGNLSCNEYEVDSCPKDCVVCPPCPACSSISCQSEEFCSALGIDSGWYKTIEARIQGGKFNDCVAAGNPVMESYPRQCRMKEETFTEYIGNELVKMDVIYLDWPRPNDIISSPILISGQARGNWFFEADFPVELRDSNDIVIAQGHASALSDWMTTEFVQFSAELEFVNPETKFGSLILKKDNPSGLSEYDDYLEIPIFFE